MMGTVTQVSDTSDAHDAPDADAPSEAGPAIASPAGGRQGRSFWRRRRRGPIDKSLLVASFVIAAGMVLVIRGLAVSITGDERAGLPEVVEEVEPVPEAVQVLSQSRVFVDLETGYTGVLVIDDVEIETVDIQDYSTQEAGAQVDLPPVTIYEGGNNTLTFIPNDDAPVAEFASGLHRVELIYWEQEFGRRTAKSFSWTFTVV